MSQELQRKLKAAREKLGMSQSQFAKLIGMSVRTLQHWEADAQTPRGLALMSISKILDDILAK